MLLSSFTDEQLLTLQKGEHVYKQVAISYTKSVQSLVIST